MKKINICSDGGYQKMQLKFLSQVEVKCDVCKALLNEHGFNEQDLDKCITDVLSGARVMGVLPQIPLPLSDQQDPDEAQREQQLPKDQEQKGKQTDEIDKRVAAMNWLRTLAPTCTVLPAGSFGRKYPVQCNICKTKKQPTGKIIELVQMTVDSARYYIGQHYKSGQHQRAMQDIQHEEDNAITVERSQCEGLSISDSEQARKLHTYQAEFRIWAMHSNFEGSARHSYTQSATEGDWNVRSQHCLKETPTRPGFEHQVCSKCHELGGAHGVSRR